MTDEKKSSKLPSLDEVTKMAGKLFGDIKKSCTDIYGDYKTKHPDAPEQTDTETEANAEPSKEKPKKPKPKASKKPPSNPDNG